MIHIIVNLGVYEKVNNNASANNVLPTIHAKYLYHLHPEVGDIITCLSWDMRCKDDGFIAIDAIEPEAFVHLVDLERIEVNNADASLNTFYSYNGILHYCSSPDILICCPQKYFNSHSEDDLRRVCKRSDDGVQLGDYSFYNVTFPELSYNIFSSATRIGDCAFSKSNLKTFTICPNLISIGMFAFADCDNLTKVIIDNDADDVKLNLRCIPQGAFFNCKALTEVHIPEGVIYIGDKAFANCTSLSKVYLPNSLSCICKDAFKGCGDVELILPPVSPLAKYGSQLTKLGVSEMMYHSGEPNLDMQPDRVNTHLEFYRNNYSVCKSFSLNSIGEGVRFSSTGVLPAVVQKLQP